MNVTLPSTLLPTVRITELATAQIMWAFDKRFHCCQLQSGICALNAGAHSQLKAETCYHTQGDLTNPLSKVDNDKGNSNTSTKAMKD